jgi:hypothetical protein
MSTKKRFLLSFRCDRESYFAVKRLEPRLDRDQSWIINRAVQLGLMALGEDPVHPISESKELEGVRMAQATMIKDMESAREPAESAD